jgi:hypothetical protein
MLKIRFGASALLLCTSILAVCASAAGAEEFAAPSAPLLSLSSPAPVLDLAGETVRWKAVGSESFYEVATSNLPRGAAGRVTHYVSIDRQPGEVQSYALKLEPGQTAYVGVSANNSPSWCIEEAVLTAPSEPVKPPLEEEEPVSEPPAEEPPVEEPVSEPPAEEPASENPLAPVISISGGTLRWAAVPGVTRYTLAIITSSSTTRVTTYKVVKGTSYTPTPLPGQTVKYGLSASVPGVAPWAKEVAVTYPPVTPTEPPQPPEPTEPPPPAKPPAGVIIGTNDGAGWGKAAANVIQGGHITWDRVEIGTSTTNTLASSLADGFKVLAIVGNTSNSTPLSQINPAQWALEVVAQIKANPGMSIAEAGNEVYYKGSVVNPIQYGTMYLAAVTAMKAAGIHVPLLFNMWGGYSAAKGFSSDTSGGGWLRDAVNAVPGLAAAILANGISTHPYGALGENYLDDNGVGAVAAQEAVAKATLGSVPPFYVTEFGYDMNKCGVTYGACSEAEQASKMRGAIETFLSDPHVKGIWWYQSHDDSIGKYGFMDNDNSTRPSFNVLSSFAAAEGQ